ncbi:unnamed protein product (mitochondrion) [Plasmodiophora brassicae]|uniref:Uncharacterized protein n=1 Tax=Plasmodiophora brassicae TaxID=37360 RepID=A0A3P3YLL2_PLABS|nr:unnamed protein product [Plasmodiophora brassicae]
MELTPSPYTVCAGVSVDMFNKFAETRSESLPLEVRFLELFAERLVIVELPSPTHESTVVEFNQAFLKACGDDEQLGKRGSSTVQRDDQPNRQSDASYGPKRNTINRIPVPDGRELENWITLAVEVGQTQDWASLRRAAECIRARSMHYELYRILGPGRLPDAPASKCQFRRCRIAAEHERPDLSQHEPFRFTIRVRVHVLARSTLLYTETLKRHRIMYCTQTSASCNTCLMNVDMSHDARDEDRPRPISSPSVARRLVVSRWSGRPSGVLRLSFNGCCGRDRAMVDHANSNNASGVSHGARYQLTVRLGVGSV